MSEQNKIEIVLALMDKATAPFVAFNRRIAQMQEPVNKLSNKFALLAKEAGIDKLSKAVGGVGGALGDVAAEAGALAAKVAAGVGIVGGALFGLVKMTSDAADGFDEMSRKAGVSSEFFQKAAYAASFASVESGALANAMGKMNANIVAANGGGKEMQTWFKRAGIGAAELKKMRPEEVFSRVMEKMKEFPKESAKAGALMKAIFGKSGGDLLPMVDGFKELAEEASRLGLVLSDDTVKAGAEFNDSFDRMMKVIKGVGMMIGEMFMPYFKMATESITQFVLANRDMIRVKIAEWIERARAAWPAFRDGVVSAWKAVTSFASDISGWIDKIGGFRVALGIVAAVMAGPLILALGALAQAFFVLGAAIMTTPIGWVVAGIAAVIAIGAVLYSYFTDMGDSMSGVFSIIGEAFGGLFAEIKNLVGLLAPVVMPILKLIGGIIGILIVGAVQHLTAMLKVLMFVLKPIVAVLSKIFEIGGAVFSKIGNFLGFGSGGTSAANGAANASGSPQGASDDLPGFRMAPPAGFAPAAANHWGSGFSSTTSTNNSRVEVDFKNMPKGVTVTPMGGTAAIDLSMGYAGVSF